MQFKFKGKKVWMFFPDFFEVSAPGFTIKRMARFPYNVLKKYQFPF